MPESKPAIATAQLSPGMAECHARILAVAKHGTPEALAATLAGVLHRAEQSIGNAYDAALNTLREEKAAPSDATADTIKAFREYLTVHPSIQLGGHDADTVARDLASIALDYQELAAEVPQFPMMLRKMWSGSEVQQWLLEHMPAFATGMYTKGFQLGMAQRTSHPATAAAPSKQRGLSAVGVVIAIAVAALLLLAAVGASSGKVYYGLNGMTEQRFISGYEHTVGTGGQARQIIDAKGRGAPCK